MSGDVWYGKESECMYTKVNSLVCMLTTTHSVYQSDIMKGKALLRFLCFCIYPFIYFHFCDNKSGKVTGK